jgi:DNA-binding transcriptional MerR regulator
MNSSTPKVTGDERLLPVGQVCRRYSVTDRTIDRWLERKILPEPIRINRYRYWRVSDLEKFERERIAGAPQDAL